MYDYSIHIYCRQEEDAVDHYINMSDADFEPFIKDTAFEGIRRGILSNDGSEYQSEIIPIWPSGKTQNAKRTKVSGSINGAISGFEIKIETGKETFSKRYTIYALRSFVLEKTLYSSSSCESISSCGTLKYSLHAAEKNTNSFPQQEEEISQDWTIEIEPTEQRLMHYDRKPLPDHGVLSGTETTFLVYIKQQLIDQIRKHAQRNLDKEVAGFLIGNVYQDTNSPEIFVLIEDQILAQHTTNESLVAVTITPASWNSFWETMKQRNGSQILVGWHHSHPFSIDKNNVDDMQSRNTREGIKREEAKVISHISTAFFSPEDMFIHQHFFNLPYHIALVVDPNAPPGCGDIAIYGWVDGRIYERPINIIEEKAT